MRFFFVLRHNLVLVSQVIMMSAAEEDTLHHCNFKWNNVSSFLHRKVIKSYLERLLHSINQELEHYCAITMKSSVTERQLDRLGT